MKKVATNNQKHIITVGCICALIFGVVAYMYFLSLSVVHVVMRKEVLQNTQQIKSEIAFLESSYIEAYHTINKNVSSASGFSAVQDKIFIRQTADTSLVLRTNSE